MKVGNIHVIYFSECYGSVEIDKVAVFNANRISEDAALQMVKSGEYDSNVLVMDKKQWINIFCDGKDDE